jgi:nitrogenase molybdenum-cofactor synthesis protein NifE
VRVLSCISGDGRYAEVATAHRARVNMMVCSKSMINIATRMQQRWHPVLRRQLLRHQRHEHTLREIARLLVETGRAGRPDGAHRSADRGGGSPRLGTHPRLPRAAPGKKVLLITGGVKSWSVVSALQEAGLEVVGTSVKKSTKEDKEKIKEIMGLTTPT